VSRNQEFYHGTVYHLSPGDVITPGGAPAVHGTSDPRFAYATGDISAAREYADYALDNVLDNQGDGEYARRIYRVTPIGRHSKDPEFSTEGEHRGNSPDDRRSKHGWKVEEELDY
jgi:hypothetical protein